MENPLLIGMQAVGIVLPQMVWVAEFLGELFFGVRLTNIAHYMFDEKIPLFVRGLSSFHGWLPFVLLWLLTRVGYDRRALRAQLASPSRCCSCRSTSRRRRRRPRRTRAGR